MIIIITTTIPPITPPAIPPALLPPLLPPLSLSMLSGGSGNDADGVVDSDDDVIDIDNDGVAVRDIAGDDVVIGITNVTIDDDDKVFAGVTVVVNDNDDDVPERYTFQYTKHAIVKLIIKLISM